MTSIETIISLFTLSGLQVVLSVDNLVVIAIVAATLAAHQRDRARVIGLALATITRLLLLFSITWIIGLTAPLLSLGDLVLSGRDLLMLAGGLFLIVKAVREMHDTLETAGPADGPRRRPANFVATIAIIIGIDIIFSLDSVMAAVAMTQDLWVTSASVVVGSIVLLMASGPVMRFIIHHPTVKILALAFVLLIGVVLLADGLGFEIPRGYVYFAIVFSVFVEGVNIVLRRRQGVQQQAGGAGERPRAFGRPMGESVGR